ncbi:MAG: hypothetical protein QM726_20875 [Chitinophagaceae bacterium]
MKKLLFAGFLLVVLLNSCASLTKSQVETVNQFAYNSKHFSAYPSKIITSLADIRVKRGVYFANSLDNPDSHIEELNNLYSAKKDDYSASAKADITFKIIDKYAQSLLLLTSDKHASDLDTQAKNFGTDLDSLITTYNAIPGATQVHKGIGGLIGSIITAGGKQMLRSQQAKEIQRFVPEADQMVGVMTDNLLEFLQSGNIALLIANEERGIQSNYKSFLNQRKPTVQNERDYLELKADLDYTKLLKDQTIEATKSLRAAHAKLVTEIKEKKTLKEVIAELQLLYEDVNNVKSTIALLNADKN